MSYETPPEADEQDLLSAARAGDDSSLWKLCEDRRARLKGVAANQLGPKFANKFDPSDVVQNAMTAAVSSFPSFKGHTIQEFEAWLLRIVRNEAHDLRKFWLQGRRSISREVGEVKGEHIGTPGKTPSFEILKVERGVRLLSIIGRLPEDEANVVRLRHLQGMKLAEIAEQIGRTPTATAGLLNRAMKRLREFASGESL